MKEFDYEQAWIELALPAYKKLPTQIHVLLETVGTAAAELSQLNDCSMPWPEDGGKLRELFDQVSTDDLSMASMVVYYYGHWWPGKVATRMNAPVIPGSEHGSSWKFSNYADQVLRERLSIQHRDKGSGVGLLIHEGRIRIYYSSINCWTWEEIAMANDAGLAEGKKLCAKLRARIGVKLTDSDNIAHKFIEELRTGELKGDWDTKRFMVEKSEIETRRLKNLPEPEWSKLRVEAIADFESEVAAKKKELDGKLWLLDHRIPDSNAIYYNHTGRWCFGWRTPYTGESRLALLESLKEFPFDYDVE